MAISSFRALAGALLLAGCDPTSARDLSRLSGTPVGKDASLPLLPYKDEVLADDPVVYLRLGEPSGAVATDEQLTFDGAYPSTHITYGVPGAIAGDSNGAVTLNAELETGDEPVGIAMPPGLDFAGMVPFSLELWAKPSAFNEYGFTLDHEAFSQERAGWVLVISDQGVGFERWDQGSTFGAAASTATTLTFDAYHHVVAVFADQTMQLFVDGELVSSKSTTRPLASTGVSWAIGRQNWTGTSGGAFIGSLDEIAVYDHGLSEESVKRHHQAGLAF